MGSAPVLISPELQQIAFSNLDMRWQSAFLNAPTFWDKFGFADMFPANQTWNLHAFLDQLPMFRKFIGPRVGRSVSVKSVLVENEPYELTVDIPVDTMLNDANGYGLFSPAVGMMGESAKKWIDNVLLLPRIQGGADNASIPLSYDGKPFYSDSHPLNYAAPTFGSPQSNLFTPAGSGATPLTQANYQKVRAAMMSLKGASGTTLGVVPNLLLVPPSLELAAKEIVEGQAIAVVYGSNTAATAPSNLTRGTATVAVWPELDTEPTAWYLLCTNRPVKPFIFQARGTPEFTFLNRPTDWSYFNERVIKYGGFGYGAGAYGPWWLASKCSP